jgi:predicted metal-dependent peptidase
VRASFPGSGTALGDAAAHRLIIQARAGLVLEHPFFGHLALQMRLVEDRTCDTAWSDGKTLAYNPLYVQMLPREKLKGLVGHVVMHPACRHHLRRQGRDPNRWNMACDYAINWILLEAGLTLPDGYLDDPDLRGRTADEIFIHLSREASDRLSDEASHAAEKQTPMETGTPVAPPEGAGRAPRPQLDGAAEDQEAAGAEAAVTEASSTEEPRDLEHGDPGRSGEVRDAPPPDGGSAGLEDGEGNENEWRIHLAQATAQARAMGDLPAGLARMVERLLSPKLDWRQLLHRFIQASSRYDYAWMPPNRRFIHQGLYLPSMRSTDLPEVVVAVDTSGSVSARELDQFAAELSAILETAAMTVHLLYCDVRIEQAVTIQREDLPLSLTPKGGGGTDFRPAFEWVERQGLSPLCLIYLTDMACSRFPNEPGYPVLWACIGAAASLPPFGERLVVQ